MNTCYLSLMKYIFISLHSHNNSGKEGIWSLYFAAELSETHSIWKNFSQIVS